MTRKITIDETELITIRDMIKESRYQSILYLINNLLTRYDIKKNYLTVMIMAKRLGVSTGAVNYRIRKLNILPAFKTNYRNYYSKEQFEMIRDYGENDGLLGTAEIASLLGKSRPTVNRYVRNSGIVPIKRHGKNFFTVGQFEIIVRSLRLDSEENERLINEAKSRFNVFLESKK